MSLPRVVLDTNILVSALRSRRGASFKLVLLIGKGKFSLHVSVPLVLEYEEVLLRHKPAALSKQDIEAFLDYICKVAKPQRIFYLWRPFLKDADDDMVLELAFNARCSHIVTFNGKDFRGSEQFGLQVVTPQEFLRKIGVLK
ncbi:MAG: putative toxin-antitoxin system toxin component, PIN family [Trueperaceae bacterium]